MTDKDFVPYIPAEKIIPEMTIKAVSLGIILSIIMAAANAYLGLYVGMTVSAAIPATVIALAVFKGLAKTGWMKDATILEVNLTKTMASAGESLAAGIIFTIPALILMGSWEEIEILPTMGIAFVGGLLGVTFTIPLRRILINEVDLPFPEGVACTEVLIAGEEGGRGAFYVFSAMTLAMLWQLTRVKQGLKLWTASYEGVIGKGKVRFYGGGELSAALLGVGYIVGPRIASLMFMGGIIGWVIILPTVGLLGEMGIYGDGWPTGGVNGFYALWGTHLKYVGVGAMVVGSIWTLWTMRQAIATGLKNANPFGGEEEEKPIRTERDISQKKAMLVALLFLIPIFIIYLHFSQSIFVSGVASVLMLISAFFFAAIAGYIAGLIGSSSNPISGVTIATLLFVSILLLALGMKGMDGKTTAIGVAAVVCAAAAIAGDVMQDLKTGQLVGNTPRVLQLGEFIGVAAAAAVIPGVLYMLTNAYTLGVDLAAPQAFVMQAIVEGIFDGNMKWEMVGLGMIIAAGIIIYSEVTGKKMSVMAVAVGIYLPFIMAVPIMLGGLIRLFSEGFIEERVHREYTHLDEEEKEQAIGVEKKEAESRGVLFSSGLIAGEALMGIGIAGLVTANIDIGVHNWPIQWPGLLIFLYIALLLGYIALRDFVEDMKSGDIYTYLKDTSRRLVYEYFNPPEEEEYEEEEEEEYEE